MTKDEKTDLSRVKPADIVVADPGSVYGSFAEYANNELKAEIVYKTNCKLCQSKFRKDAEEKYARTANIVNVHRFLQDSGEEISYQAVRNHLTIHYMRPELEVRLKEYAEDIHSWTKIRQEKEDIHREHIAILQRRIRLMEANTDDSSNESQRRTAETVAKLIDQIGKEQERMESLKEDESTLKIVLLKFEDLVKTKLENMSVPEARVALVDVLEGFAQIIAEFEDNA
jgi:hypothetical protein